MSSTSVPRRIIAVFIVTAALILGMRYLAYLGAGMSYGYRAINGGDPEASRCLPSDIKTFESYDAALEYADSVGASVTRSSWSDRQFIVAQTKPDMQCGWLDDFRSNALNWIGGAGASALILLLLLAFLHFIAFNRWGIYRGWLNLPEKSSLDDRRVRTAQKSLRRANAEIALKQKQMELDKVAVAAAKQRSERMLAEAQAMNPSDPWPTPQNRRNE